MNWSEDPAVRRKQLLSEARRAVGSIADNLDGVADAVLYGTRRTESPIEASFAIWFNTVRAYQLSLGNLRCAVALRPQVVVECPSGVRYRLDFTVEPLDAWLRDALDREDLPLRLSVELDGHAFHERTPEQVIRRNQRDRDLMSLGWRVLHYSGSELHANPIQAAVDVLETGADLLDAAKTELARR